MTPEALARLHIDRLLQLCGWHVCNINQVNLHAAQGVAIREFPLNPGRASPHRRRSRPPPVHHPRSRNRGRRQHQACAGAEACNAGKVVLQPIEVLFLKDSYAYLFCNSAI